ncbi:hypothetical protein K8640_14200 [Myxococcus sp. XM-1-1-1]|uniref:hypothetical protein n=1 Tax=Myxococcus sp. XM-1-1-1 TaxID=2874602 RepID=UPI001CBB4812|nr:hypothetical protein [Myxococcus sp. XM-1-1-1]MBZ4409373.1 hypothetical protein [Myxococcus sp. XM-1-1-1]
MRMLVVVSFVFFVVGCGAPARSVSPGDVKARSPLRARVDDAELVRVQARARAIVAAENAAIAATDAFLATKDHGVEPARRRMNVTASHGGAWYGLFGSLDENEDFIPSLAWKAPLEEPARMERVPVESLPKDFSPQARAVATAQRITVETFGRKRVNPVVLGEESGELTVYTLQGTRERGMLYFGGDFRFRFSADGRRVVEQVKLHTSVLEVDSEQLPGGSDKGVAHDHLLFEGPLETELALMMLYPGLLGVLVVVSLESNTAYVLTGEGAIHVVSATEEKIVRVLNPDGTLETP